MIVKLPITITQQTEIDELLDSDGVDIVVDTAFNMDNIVYMCQDPDDGEHITQVALTGLEGALFVNKPIGELIKLWESTIKEPQTMEAP